MPRCPVSDQHFLIVHEVLDDGMDIEHPPSCPTESRHGGQLLVHTCEVERHIDVAGLDLFFHRDQPHPHSFGHSTKVTPGRWPIEVWSERTRYPGGWEYDGGLRLSGMRAAPGESFDEFDLWVGEVWEFLQQQGHLDCGGWSLNRGDTAITCACGAKYPVAEEASDAASS